MYTLNRVINNIIPMGQDRGEGGYVRAHRGKPYDDVISRLIIRRRPGGLMSTRFSLFLFFLLLVGTLRSYNNIKRFAYPFPPTVTNFARGHYCFSSLVHQYGYYYYSAFVYYIVRVVYTRAFKFITIRCVLMFSRLLLPPPTL